MTETEIQECKDMFKHFDRNKNGTIDIDELQDVMLALWLNPTREEMEREMNRFAKDKKELTFDEFLDFMAEQESPEDAEQELRAAFSQFDKNGDGTISVTELRERMIEMGCPMDDDQVAEMMKEADMDGNGVIDIDEFVAVMMQQNSQQSAQP